MDLVPSRIDLVQMWQEEQEEKEGASEPKKRRRARQFSNLPTLTIEDRAEIDPFIASEVRRGDWDY